MSWSTVSFASWSTISFPSMPQWLGTQQKRTWVPLSLNAQRRFMIWQMRGLSVSSPSIACKQYIESGVDYNIMLYRIHVLVIVQCQCDCCCLSSKDGTVIWESFGQLVASCLTILDMAVDDRCCPHSLVNLRSVRVDFVMWSLSIGHIWGLQFNRYICFSFRGNRPIFGWVPYLTLKIQGRGQGHDENQPKSNQVIYKSGPTMKEIQKVVQKSSLEQKTTAAAGVLTSRKT